MEEWQDRQCDAHTSGLCARLQIMPLYTQQILAPLPDCGSLLISMGPGYNNNLKYNVPVQC